MSGFLFTEYNIYGLVNPPPDVTNLGASHQDISSGAVRWDKFVDLSNAVVYTGNDASFNDLSLNNLSLNNLCVKGNLTVIGNTTKSTTTIHSTNLDISDNIITLNSRIGNTEQDTTTGILMRRGAQDPSSAFMGWVESGEYFALGLTDNSGTTIDDTDIITEYGTLWIGDISANNINLQGDISANDASFKDVSLNYLYVRNDISANNIHLQGDISASNIHLQGDISANDASFKDVSLNYLYVRNDISTNNINLQGDLSANNINLQGDISANDASFKDVSLNYLYVRNDISANNINLQGDLSANNINLQGDISANDASFKDVSLNYLYVRNDISASNINLQGDLSANNIFVLPGIGGETNVVTLIQTNTTDIFTNTSTISTLQVKLDEGEFADGDKTKLDAIEVLATADQTPEEIRTAVASADDSNVFTDAALTALNSAVQYESVDGDLFVGGGVGFYGSEFKFRGNGLVGAASIFHALMKLPNVLATDITLTLPGSTCSLQPVNGSGTIISDAERTKLSGIETLATADQTAAEIRVLVEDATDSNVFTDAKKTLITTNQTNITTNASGISTNSSNILINAGTNASQTLLIAANTVLAGNALPASSVLNEDNFASNSNTLPPSQDSVRVYVDARFVSNLNEITSLKTKLAEVSISEATSALRRFTFNNTTIGNAHTSGDWAGLKHKNYSRYNILCNTTSTYLEGGTNIYQQINGSVKLLINAQQTEIKQRVRIDESTNALSQAVLDAVLPTHRMHIQGGPLNVYTNQYNSAGSANQDLICLDVNNGTNQLSGISWRPLFGTVGAHYTKRSAGIYFKCDDDAFRGGLAFYTNNTTSKSTSALERMNINQHGNVGIGITNPLCPLHIKQSSLYQTNDSGISSFGDLNSVSYLSVSATGIETSVRHYNFTSGGYNLSLYAEGMIFTSSYVGASDIRIKKDITEIDDERSLIQLRNLPCVDYNYIDDFKNGEYKTVGFIAQQVKEHMPNCINMVSDIIPNEMRKLETFSWEEMDISGNIKYKLITEGLEECSYRFIVKDASSNEQRIEEAYPFLFEKKWDEVFLYGKRVDDFLAIDKNKIFAVAFSATQEIDRIQQSEKIKLETAETKLATTEVKLSATEVKLEEQTNKLEAAEVKLGAAEVKISTLESENTALKSRLDAIESRLTSAGIN